MNNRENSPIEVVIIAVPETAGSALYGMVDVLLAAGNIWQTLVRTDPVETLFRVRILSEAGEPFVCGNGIPVTPDFSVTDDPEARIVILPELWLGPDEHLRGRYPELMDWIRRQHRHGSSIYSACSGAVMLAETGLLNTCERDARDCQTVLTPRAAQRGGLPFFRQTGANESLLNLVLSVYSERTFRQALSTWFGAT